MVDIFDQSPLGFVNNVDILDQSPLTQSTHFIVFDVLENVMRMLDLAQCK
jgi:hypothetical protein